jgi:two-component system, response regulator PdtaR
MSASAVAAPGPAPAAGLRVLIVEDEVLIALELESLLADAGHEIVGIADCAEAAITLGRDHCPDLALVDLHLTDGPTGIEVARRLSRAPATTVIFMTANAKRIPQDFAGAAGVIAKPYSARLVRGALRFVAERRSGAPPVAPPDGMQLAPSPAAG